MSFFHALYMSVAERTTNFRISVKNSQITALLGQITYAMPKKANFILRESLVLGI